MSLRVPVNLASEPFVGTRRVLVGTIAAAILLAACLGLLIALSLMERGQADQIQASLNRLRAQDRTLAAEQARLEATLRKPENAVVLERSLFLNSLLCAKGISWTRLFDDLEQVMPHNVRLVSIRPQVNANNQVQLDIVVGAETEEPVIQLLMRMENSTQFGQTTPQNRMPPTQSEPLLRFRFSANYTQRLDADPASSARVVAALTGRSE